MLLESNDSKNKNLRIFLITDGDDPQNTKEILKLIKLKSDLCQIHVFGIGEEINETFIKDIALNGRGTA